MTAKQFASWRTRCGLSSWQAVADALGLSWRQVMRYQSGQAPIPRTVELLCNMLEGKA